MFSAGIHAALVHDVYVVGFVGSERLTAEAAWLRQIDLFAAY
jgi:hypothetical protein